MSFALYLKVIVSYCRATNINKSLFLNSQIKLSVKHSHKAYRVTTRLYPNNRFGECYFDTQRTKRIIVF